MLYLITGVPGSGKTLKMISDLMNRKDLKDRPLYLDGIPEVKGDIIPNLPIPEGESMQTWHKWAPPGAILVIDECQRVFRPRPSGSKVPDFVAELETHRHRGIDIFLLTQHPRLIDVNVRSLIGHHCHISKTNFGVRRMVEWEGLGDPTSRSSIKDGLKSVYRLDKRAFGVYKSAEEHTKINTKLSKVVYIAPIVGAVIIGAMFMAYQNWTSYSEPKKQTEQQTTAEMTKTETAEAKTEIDNGKVGGQYPTEDKKPEKPHLSEEDYQPRIAERPETAPMYDGMNKAVRAMPYPVACIKVESRCTCYTEQGTKIKDIGKKTCLNYVKDGLPFNPYKVQTVENATPTQTAYKPNNPQVLTMGGQSPQNLMYDGYNDKALTNAGGKVNL